eukprot:gene44005-biopygen37404
MSSVQVLVQQGNVVSNIEGGLTQTVQVGSHLIVDASKSYDEDQDEVTGVDAGLSFAWTCIQISPLSESCSGIFTNVGQVPLNGVTFQATVSSSTVGYIAQIFVTVSLGARTSTSSIALTVLSYQSALVSVTASSVNSIVASDQVLKLYGVVTVPLGTEGTVQWAANDASIVDLPSVSLSPLEYTIPPGVNTFNVYLAVAANSLPTGSSLGFSLTSTTATTLVSTSSISVTVNAPPAPGTFQVTPVSSVVGSVQMFTFSASNWDDADRPIKYQFGYTSNAGTQVVLVSLSEATFSTTTVPSGLASASYMVQCFAEIVDALGANTSVSYALTVSVMVTTRTQLSSMLTGSVTVNEIKQATAL